MKHVKQLLALLSVSALLMISCDKNGNNNYPDPQPPTILSTVIKIGGDGAALTNPLTEFKVLLGDPVNGAPGQVTGRREVNWEGVPANFNNNNTFPLDFFNVTDANGPNGRKRGLVYVNTGSPIRIDSSKFEELDASYAAQLPAFSGKRALVSATSTVSEIVFKVAGTNTDAFVKGFGIIFIDVDDANSSSLEFFNGNRSLGVFKAPVGAFSLLGVRFPDEKVTRIKITAGNGVLAAGVKDVSSGGNKDIVAYDDFFYDEPKVIN
jgi:hypothetical protein